MKFIRRNYKRHPSIGKGRKKKHIWRKPKGRDNKMREKRRGYPATVSIGYGNSRKLKGKINEKTPIVVITLKDLEKIGKDSIAILGNIGNKKKIEIVKKANEKKIEIFNLNIKKFLKKIERKINQKKEAEKNSEKKPEQKAKKDIKEDKKE
ncbi:MAG: eL32 family ribosomal protein [Nanoarchaeota archaeon]